MNIPVNSLLERKIVSSLSTEELLRIPGEFTCEVRRADDVVEYFCSANGVAQLFYGSFDSHVCVGSTVDEVLKTSGENWSWDYEALGQMATFGHLLGNRTLHRFVKRLGAGEVLRKDARGFTISKITNIVESTPDDSHNEALKALIAYVKAEGRDGDLLSFSAGFDSRVILAAFLNLGIRPTLVVMGDASSTDVSIATRIAEELSLPRVWVPLDFRRMMQKRSEIVSMTSGTKTVEHWHTFDYVQACEVPAGASIWIGTNGEIARTLFFDRGLQFYLAEVLSPVTIRKFWREKLRRCRVPEQLKPHLCPELRYWLGVEPQLSYLTQFFPARQFGELIDLLYTERVRQFHSNGLRLVSSKYTPKTPFLDPNWMAAIRAMGRPWKLGNRWHRWALSKLYPSLLDFPTDETGVNMRQAPGYRYWLGLSHYLASHSHNIPYMNYETAFKTELFQSTYSNAVKGLGSLFADGDPSLIVKPEQVPDKALTFFGALGFFMEEVNKSSMSLTNNGKSGR